MKFGSFYSRKIRGMTLVELMVSITIGLIILAAVSTLFVNSKRTYTAQDRQARLQENARFAMQFIIKDIRLVGYYGCLSDINTDTVHSTLNGTGFQFDTQTPIEGLENAAGSWYPSGNTSLPTGINAGTDAITLRMADVSSAVSLSNPMPQPSAILQVTSITGVNPNDIIMISDCSSADLTQVTATNGSALTIQHNAGAGTNPGNMNGKAGDLSKSYAPPTSIMKFITRRYYISNNPNGIPSLYRDDNLGTPLELVEGIESLQILYGKDTNGDKIPDVYLKAGASGLQTATDWLSVKSVRIGIIARTVNTKDTDIDSAAYDVDGDGSTDFTAPGDHNKRRVFQTTVVLRNLQYR